MRYQIIRVHSGVYAVVGEGNPVPEYTGTYEGCQDFVERERLPLCRS